MGKPYVKPRAGQWISQKENLTVKTVVASVQPTTTDTAALDAQIALLQGQVNSLNSQIATLQSEAVQDAATIASLQGQVTTLNQQIAALQAQVATYKGFGQFYFGPITTVGGGIDVPPSFDDVTVNLASLKPTFFIGPVSTIGGGYP